MPRYDFECYDGHRFEHDCRMDEIDNEIPCKESGCERMAKQIITHSHPEGWFDHGAASNRDAAREGRYDPNNPNRRFMTKGRSWRK